MSVAPHGSGEFTVVETNDHRTFVRFAGSLDVVMVNRITLDFTRHVAMHRRSTVVDLSGVDFLASIGMGLLIANARALKRHGATMILVDPQAAVERALRHAGIDEVIPIAHGPAEVEALLAGSCGPSAPAKSSVDAVVGRPDDTQAAP